MKMLRDNSITVYISHRVDGASSLRSSALLARKREDDEDDGRTPCVKEEDTCVRAMAEAKEEEEKGRRKAGEEEEREKVDEGKDGLSTRCTRVPSESCDTCCELINGAITSVREEKNAIAMSRVSFCLFCFSYEINCIKALTRNLRHT